MLLHYKNSDYKQGALRIFLCKVFVLICLRMALVQVETCSAHIEVTF